MLEVVSESGRHQSVLVRFRIIKAEYFAVELEVVLVAELRRVHVVQCVVNVRQIPLYK